jgi:hypothetical protein
LKNLGSFAAIPQILKEPIFEKAFQTAEFTKFSRAQRDAYEQSVMDDIGVREVAVTAREDRDTEHILRMHKKGKSVAEICDLLDIPEQQVIAIVQDVLNH